MILYKYKNPLLGILLFVILPISACKKWLDINYNTNQAVESNTDVDQILPGALSNTANLSASPSFLGLNNWMGYWCPPAGVSTNVEEQSYNVTTGFSSSVLFSNIYVNNVNYDLVDKKAFETGQDFYRGIAKIMKAHNFVRLVDIFNNIPYTEALKTDTHPYPVYTEGRFIYEESMKQLDSAIALIKGAIIGKNIRINIADIMFKGNKARWIKLANTLKLRLLIHQANRPDRTTYIQSEIAKIVAEGTGFISSGENAAVNPGYIQSSNQTNAYYNAYGFTATGGVGGVAGTFVRANIIAMNFLKADQDPRLGFFYKPIQTSVPSGGAEPFSQPPPKNYRGNQYGLPIVADTYPYQSANYVSAVGGITAAGAVTTSSSGIIKGYNMDMWVLTSVESLFLQAEAIQRGWMQGDAKTAYIDAVKESFLWLNVNGSQAAATTAFNNWYAAQAANANVNWNITPDKYKLLMYQKYMALNGIAPLETWTDYRRNGAYPDIPLSANPGRTSNTLPVRLLYPQGEYTNNTANVTAQGTINQFTSKIWWMP